MNYRTATIILVTSIPIIVVAYIVLDFYLTETTIHETCENHDICVRFCCRNGDDCDETPEQQAEIQTYIDKKINSTPNIIRGFPCKKSFGIELNKTWFLENGHINEENVIYHWDQYCIGVHDGEITSKICLPDNLHDEIQEVYVYFMIGSMPFLIITLIVYGFLKDLRNLHGKCLIAYVSSLTIMYTTLILNGLQMEDLIENHSKICKTIGYTFLTSLLCCFFWLNVMCYDIYRTFKKGIKSEDNIQYLKYCGYAFGVPVIITFLNFILNNFELIPESINNGIGNETCSIPPSNQTLQWIYIYGPIMFQFVINISFYGITAWKIFHVQSETSKVCKTENSRRHAKCSDSNSNHTRFFLYLRLSVVMGVPWIIELLSFVLENSPILFIASIFNCMQGFVVFITFVWNPKVTKQLQRRYTAMSVSYKKQKSSTKQESVKGESVKRDSVETAVTKVVGFTSDSSAQV